MTTKITREYLANSTLTALPIVAPTTSNVVVTLSDPLQITVNGRNFAPGVLLTLNNRYFANSVRIIDSTQLIAEIPGDVPVGTYDIYLVRPSGRFSIFPDGITLT